MHMRAIFHTLTLTISVLVAMGVATGADTLAAPPAGMTQEQYDALVDDISTSVAQKLKAEGAQPAAKAKPAKEAPPAQPEAAKLPAKKGPGPAAVFLQRAGKVVRAYPELGRRIGVVVGGLGEESSGGWGIAGFLLVLGLVAAAAVVAEAALRLLLRKPRARLAVGAGPEHGFRSLVNLSALLLLDGMGVLAVWFICNAASAWFAGETMQDKLAEAVLAGIFAWRLALLLFRFVLQPDEPTARLCAATSEAAQAMYSRVATVLLLLIVGRTLGQILIASGTSPEALAAYQLGGLAIFLAAFLWLIFRSQDAARQWLEGLSTAAPLAGVVARHWTGIASSFLVALALTQAYSAISGRVQVGGAMLITLGLVVGVVFFEALVHVFVRW